MTNTLELGVDTFGDVTAAPDGSLLSQAATLRNVVEQAVVADQVGLDFFAVGEHHRPDFTISTPEVILAAIASRTTRLRLGSAVTVLSTDDPVRVFQRFSTLHAISSGRAEIVVGRGSFTESFPLFGHDLGHYDALFEEKLNLLVEILKGEPVTWKGQLRSPLDRQPIYPPAEPGMRVWVAVGGSPESVVRAAYYGLPLMLAIIGGEPARFAPWAELYRDRLAKFGKEPQPIGVHSPGHVAETDAQAKEELWPHYAALMNRIGAERGWPPIGRDQFEQAAGPSGSLYVGSPETVANKIVATMKALGLSRFELKYANGPLPHETLCKSLELYGTKVVPMVRERMAP